MILDFFKRPSFLPRGPAALSLLTGAPIIPGFMIREKDDKFRLIIEKPIRFSPSGNKEIDQKTLTERCIERIEKYVKRYPDQWFMFSKFWLG
jgi:KDO2-lipid IV(A) lauroyltransferase